MSLVLDWAGMRDAALGQVGGKALNLAALSVAGLAVPGGFCLTTDAYRLVVGSALADLIVAMRDCREPAELAALAARARERVLAIEPPRNVREGVVAAYDRLGPETAVAVRSSATAEDLASASFAGQQDSFLNVVGATGLMTAVRACWASLWSDRAVAYRQANQVSPDGLALAVVVQRMVDASVAGVMFTANPVTGNRRQTVIDASPGLGEAVVSGAVNPDHFVIDRTARSVVDRKLGDKRLMVASVPGGGTEQRSVGDQTALACLNEKQLLTLADLGDQVQGWFSSPQDIEWALDSAGSFWLTQARPITTLYPAPPQAATGAAERRVLMCMTLAQGLTRPITPMGLAAFRLIGSAVADAAGSPPTDRLAGPAMLQVIGQRMFFDLTAVLGSPAGRRIALRIAGAMEARTAQVLRALVADPELRPAPRSARPALRPVARVVLLRAKVPLKIALALVAPRAAYAALARAERRLGSKVALPAHASAAERLDHVEQGLGGEVFLLMPSVFGYPACGLLMLGVARRVLGPLARPDELQTVLRGLPHNVTTEMDLRLWHVTETIRGDPASLSAFADLPADDLAARYRRRTLPAAAQHGLAGFFRRYGHRGVGEIDLGMPRWSQEPSQVISFIINYLRLTDPAAAPQAQFRQGEIEAEAMLAELVRRARGRNRARATVVRFALRRARQLVGLRESPKFLLVTALSAFRRDLILLGEALAATGVLEKGDDVFFLDFAETRRALAGEPMRHLIPDRREAYGAELRRRHIPRLLLGDGTEPETILGGGGHPDGSLTGSPASPGVVTGPARVVLDPVGAQLQPGEILVAPSTDPGWTPLFLTAGGLVMEMGGPNSHGAVVAREYGIPAVVGVPNAASRLTTGQQVTVDGAAGTVSIEDATGGSA